MSGCGPGTRVVSSPRSTLKLKGTDGTEGTRAAAANETAGDDTADAAGDDTGDATGDDTTALRATPPGVAQPPNATTKITAGQIRTTVTPLRRAALDNGCPATANITTAHDPPAPIITAPRPSA